MEKHEFDFGENVLKQYSIMTGLTLEAQNKHQKMNNQDMILFLFIV